MRTIEEIQADISENNKNQLANRFERSHALITEFLYAVTDEITLDRLEEICNAERDGRLMVLPDNDWADLVTQINVIISNDFAVYKGNAEFVVCNMVFADSDNFSFTAKCSNLHISDGFHDCLGDYDNCCFCEEHLRKIVYDTKCIITFEYTDIGKTVFLTREEAKQALKGGAE